MLIHSTRFGEIEVPKDQLISFANGLPGFPDETQFAFLTLDEGSSFVFLQSASNPDLTFVVVEPFMFFNDYTFELSDEYVEDLKLSQENKPRIFNIVTIRDTIEKATANLLAPIIVNWQTKKAVQVILDKTPFTTRHKLFPNGLPQAQTAKGGK
ncbi:Flagellar assembly factor FliW [bioreactor metagenome]|uniref:Flagellar assembly factor FliW n=1 Tax=bioreactor metagenome TaxID=1076179 RepID=A0A644XYM3_9ZZZZ